MYHVRRVLYTYIHVGKCIYVYVYTLENALYYVYGRIVYTLCAYSLFLCVCVFFYQSGGEGYRFAIRMLIASRGRQEEKTNTKRGDAEKKKRKKNRVT